MKNIKILFVLFMVLLANCEKVVEIDVPSIEPKLIIEATFEVLFDENPIISNNTVALRLTADFFEDSIPKVTNATVFVTNMSDGNIINYNDLNADGDYEPENPFVPQDNVEYKLTVIYDGETYEGTATRIKSTTLTNIVQGDETLFTGNETQIKIDFTDDGSVENYYLFDFSEGDFRVLEDRFFNGKAYNFTNFYSEEELELPQTVNIKMSGITKDYFTYFRVLSSQSGEGGGGPFETVPSTLLGNIINMTNEANFPLGYFHISETDTFAIDLVDKN
ncbi:DUF4249 family protein [uncultured Polaribacter sp.]|uniref:DUF4249 family protein n=1 Tax=uncultured Polaribacter sp. TaxID=174711 RepID=UPI002608B676|nr:DUF4249 family protein [uncultured Polaribacter sp.]